MLVVDDECFFEHHSEGIEWPDAVRPLIASPSELKRRGMENAAVAAELERIEELRAAEALARRAAEKEQARLDRLASDLLDDLPELDRRLIDLKVKEFEAVTALAVADKAMEALVILKGRADQESGKKWEARREQVVEALEAG